MQISTVLFCVLIFFQSSSQEQFDPYKFNYCKLKCHDGKHTACNCKRKGKRYDILDDIVNFREYILHEHNQYRNYVASGEAVETYPNVPSASNMMALNYDLELEYIARCLASNSFKQAHDPCHFTHDNEWVGQNLSGTSDKNFTKEAMQHLMYNLFIEIKHMSETAVDKFEGAAGHFTQMMWSNTDRVGCARMWNPGKGPDDKAVRGWNTVLICNFGNLKGTLSNTMFQPIYKKGEPCTECPNGLKCEDPKYTALCGKVLPVPKDIPKPFKGGAVMNKPCLGQILLVGTCIVLVLFD